MQTDKTAKRPYEAPAATALDIRQESVICISDLAPIYDNPFTNGENW